MEKEQTYIKVSFPAKLLPLKAEDIHFEMGPGVTLNHLILTTILMLEKAIGDDDTNREMTMWCFSPLMETIKNGKGKSVIEIFNEFSDRENEI